ncbi:MAG: hypothetical protein ACO3UU_07490 [Minisyncoccia bacterium]
MDKIIYILQNIENVEDWEVYSDKGDAEDAKNIKLYYLSPDKRAEEGKKWVIITRII